MRVIEILPQKVGSSTSGLLVEVGFRPWAMYVSTAYIPPDFLSFRMLNDTAMGSKANKNPLQDKNIDPAHIRGMDSSGLGDHKSASSSTFRLPVMD